VAPRLSVSQITTFRSSFLEDVHNYTAAGLDGIGIWEMKLGDDRAADAEKLEALEASGLERASAIPGTPSILPLPLFGGPEDPQERLDALCASVERLAAFRPPAMVCLTGSARGRDADEARAIVVDGLRTLAAEAERNNIRIGIEPYERESGEPWTIVSSIADAVELIHDAGDPPALGIQFDTWHLWNSESLYDDIANEIDRFVGVHVNDTRVPTRGFADRVLPGDGCGDVPRILRALDEAGWDGLYDIEIFSDDGTFGSDYPDSLWAADPESLLPVVRDAFTRCFPPSPTSKEST
jgi:sugar phosphate isomerase/epimerase